LRRCPCWPITPIIALTFGQPNFSALSFTINSSHFLYGDFLNNVFTFVTTTAVIFFFVVRPFNRLMARRSTEDPDTRDCPRVHERDPNQGAPVSAVHLGDPGGRLGTDRCHPGSVGGCQLERWDGKLRLPMRKSSGRGRSSVGGPANVPLKRSTRRRGTFAVVRKANVPRDSRWWLRGTFAVVRKANVPREHGRWPKGTFAGQATPDPLR